MIQKQRLDFEALLSVAEATPAQASAAGYEVKQINVSDIGRYDDNRILTDADIADLYSQLQEDEFDLIHPVVIFPDPRSDREYTLICGERRHMCFKKAGRESIVAIIRRDLTPKQIREKNLIENDQRLDEPLNSRGKRYKKYINDFDVSQAEAARKFGKTKSFMNDLVNYFADMDDFPLVSDLYDSGNGLTDRHVLKNLLVISKKSDSAGKSIINFGLANRCLNRPYTEAALEFDLHGDTEQDCLNWLQGFKEEKQQVAAIKAEKKAAKAAKEKKNLVADNGGDNGPLDDNGSGEEQLQLDNLSNDVKESEEDNISVTTNDVLIEEQVEPVVDSKSIDPLCESGGKKQKFKSRPLTEAEVMLEYQGANYYLDLHRVASDPSKILLRNLAGEFFEVDPAAVTISYVH